MGKKPEYNNTLGLIGKPSIFKDKTWGVLIEEIPTDSEAATKKGFQALIDNGDLVVTVRAKNGKEWPCLVSEIRYYRRSKDGESITSKVKVTEIVDPKRQVYIPEGEHPCFANLGNGTWGLRFASHMAIPDTGTQVEVEKRGGRFRTVILGEMVKEGNGYTDFSITPWPRKKKAEG